jgi:hypothetical protein
MAHGLLISDHELINDLYKFNLAAFVDLSLTAKENLNDALQIIELGAHGDVVICLSTIAGEDAAFQVYQKLKESNSAAQLVIIGSRSQANSQEGVITLPPDMNIPTLIKTCASILGVTAKDMIGKPVPDHYPIPLTLLEGFDQAPCNIYVKVTRDSAKSDFVICLEKGQEMQSKMQQYRKQGLASLFIPSDLRLEIVNKASVFVLKRLDDPNLSTQEKTKVAEQAYDVVGGLLGESSEVTPEVVAISKKCVETIKGVISEMPKLKNLLTGMLADKTGYLYLHCVMCSYVSRHVINVISWGSEEHSEKLGFVFFFQNMFLTPIFSKYPHFKYEEDLLFRDELGEKEKEVVINHARLASEMVKKFPRCPMGADAIILQQHGTTNGLGFAMDYKDDISPLAKVVIVCGAFVDELMRAKDEGQIPPDLNGIIANLRSKFTKHTYKKIINCLETVSF